MDDVIASSQFTEDIHRHGPLPILNFPQFDVGDIKAKKVAWVDERSDGAPLNVAPVEQGPFDSLVLRERAIGSALSLGGWATSGTYRR